MPEAIEARTAEELDSNTNTPSVAARNIQVIQATPVTDDHSSADDDSPVDEIKESFQQWRAFWRTRRAILTGEYVFDYNAQKLAAKGMMGPWRFNAVQSLASAVTAGLVAIVLKIVWPDHGTDPSSSADKVEAWLSTGLAPFSLLVVANLIGWASLWKEDHDTKKRQRAARAYLYYDAAYGFLPQCLLGIGSALAVGAFRAGMHGQGKHWGYLLGGGSLLWAIVWIWQARLTSRTFPSKLFSVNGYSPRLPSMWRLRQKIENPGPYRLYRMVTFTAVPLVLASLHFSVWGVARVAGKVWDRLLG